MLSDRKDLILRARDANGKPANRYHKRSKLDEKGQRSCTVKTEGEKTLGELLRLNLRLMRQLQV